MPRIRQYAERDAMKDFLAEVNAQCARYGYRTQADIGKALGYTQRTICNYLKSPKNIRFDTLRTMVKVLKLDPGVVLKALGYSTQDIKKLAKEYTMQ